MWWVLGLQLGWYQPDNTTDEETSSSSKQETTQQSEGDKTPSDSTSEGEVQENQAVEISPEQRKENLIQLWSSMSDEDLVQQVFARQKAGKYDSAQQMLDFLVDRNVEPYHRYLWAYNTELLELYAMALEEYDDLLTEQLQPQLKLNVRFRRAIVLDDMGTSRKAVSEFKKLKRQKHLLHEGDQEKLDLLIGAALIHQGRDWCGTRKLNTVLALVDTNHGWHQARARSALVKVLIRFAEKTEIQMGKNMGESITIRLNKMSAAEQQLGAIIQLEQSEFILDSVIDIVDAYLRFYDDAITVPPPQGYTDIQVKIYEQALLEKAEVLRRKAFSYASKGVGYARNVGWQGQSTKDLVARREALRKEMQR